MLGGGSLANDAAAAARRDGAWEIQGDPTEAAFLVAERKLAGTDASVQRVSSGVGEIPFTSERKLMIDARDRQRAERRTRVLISKGAPDVLLGRCSPSGSAPRPCRCTDELETGSLAEVEADWPAGALAPWAVAYR